VWIAPVIVGAESTAIEYVYAVHGRRPLNVSQCCAVAPLAPAFVCTHSLRVCVVLGPVSVACAPLLPALRWYWSVTLVSVDVGATLKIRYVDSASAPLPVDSRASFGADAEHPSGSAADRAIGNSEAKTRLE
jgi:hypothetical protein